MNDASSAAAIPTSPPAHSVAPVPTEAPTSAKTASMQEQLTRAYLTPIAVYGRVVDEIGEPVQGALVQIQVDDKPLQSGSIHTKRTEADGSFSVIGVHGMGFRLVASKEGYYTTKTSRGHRNVVVPSTDDLPHSTKERPIVLALRKQGETVPLIFTESGQIVVPTDGQLVLVDLANGRQADRSEGDLHLASWVGNTKQRPYDWRYQVSIPGGGLVERKGPYEFEAPLDGYKSMVKIDMPATAEKWAIGAEREYFAKLRDGRFARFQIRFHPRHRNFVVIESYVNPQPGSRNLEYDPEKQVLAR